MDCVRRRRCEKWEVSYFFSLADMLVKEIWREVSCKTIYIIYLKDEMYHYIRYIFDDNPNLLI